MTYRYITEVEAVDRGLTPAKYSGPGADGVTRYWDRLSDVWWMAKEDLPYNPAPRWSGGMPIAIEWDEGNGHAND